MTGEGENYLVLNDNLGYTFVGVMGCNMGRIGLVMDGRDGWMIGVLGSSHISSSALYTYSNA
jgi:hypothetical protein